MKIEPEKRVVNHYITLLGRKNIFVDVIETREMMQLKLLYLTSQWNVLNSGKVVRCDISANELRKTLEEIRNGRMERNR